MVTDNDGNLEALEKKYKKYEGMQNIKLCYSRVVHQEIKIGEKYYNNDTLEPEMVRANNNNLDLFNGIFTTKYNKVEEMIKYMEEHKTDCALKIFQSNKKLEYPKYILEAIENDEK